MKKNKKQIRTRSSVIHEFFKIMKCRQIEVELQFEDRSVDFRYKTFPNNK